MSEIKATHLLEVRMEWTVKAFDIDRNHLSLEKGKYEVKLTSNPLNSSMKAWEIIGTEPILYVSFHHLEMLQNTDWTVSEIS